jgi:hypothetical protein
VAPGFVAAALTVLAALAAGCGADSQTQGPVLADERWTVEVDRERGFSMELPPGWTRATVKLTPQITEPREILTVATLPIEDVGPYDMCGPASRSALTAFTDADALVTLQEAGRGALRINPLSHPPRPQRFAPEDFPHSSIFTDCLVADLPVEDHWFGFADAGRAFHVLVIVGRAAPAHVRDEAWSILDRLQLDPDVRPTWEAST